jgi:cytochrome c oxidase subunit 4
MSGHVSPKSTYYAIFGALMVLTVVTIVVAYQPLGSWNFPVAISIAVTKATLVILFFMHAKYSSKLTKLFVGTAFFFLLIMLTLTMTDNMSRGMKTYPGGAGGAGYGQRQVQPTVGGASQGGTQHEGSGTPAH